MITCLTHITDGRDKCANCGIKLPEIIAGSGKHIKIIYNPTQGERVGVITSTGNTGSIAYKVGEHDSNKPCNQNT